MKATIITASRPVNVPSSGDIITDAKYVAGSNAGICYMNGSYFDEKVSGNEQSLNRCEKVLSTAHHSIANHAYIEVLFEGISKAAAMILNNLTFYAASEKSGRYTEMTGQSDLEQRLYTKWRGLLKNCIKCEYPIMDDKLADKLAMENARMFISANAPIVTLGYSTALNQWSYIVEWFREYSEWLQSMDTLTKFDLNLAKELKEISQSLTDIGLYDTKLCDPKRRTIRTLHDELHDIRGYMDDNIFVDYVNDMHFTNYIGSFAMVAQMQRHRTLRLKIRVPSLTRISTYHPPIIDPSDMLSCQWNNDMNTLYENGILPIGAKLMVSMIGSLDDYNMMLDERLCGRAQLEIMQTSFKIVDEISRMHASHMQYDDFIKFETYLHKTKCQRNGGCKEPCMFISGGLRNKKI